MNNEIYSNPLCERYSSKEMMYNFSPDKKFSTWRKLWIALAESEKELGLDISQEQIDEMKKNIHNIDYELAAKKEKDREGGFLIQASYLLGFSQPWFPTVQEVLQAD